MKTETKVYDVRERTYRYALEMLKFLETLPDDYITRTIGKQLLRSATSVGANVAEAKGSTSKRDFANFYSYSLKSANESKFWLGLLRDGGKAPVDRVKPLLDETFELSSILASSLMTMHGKKRL
ncbi:MAG: four helix bundle protein [Candidatus Omnitrophota bacterium]|nr:four helix bundle protein [Candidatus Omnitrophota bacterium]